MVPKREDDLSESRPKRVLLIAPQPFYSDRGTPMNVLQMCRVLTRNGYLVDLATYPLGRDVDLPGLRIRRALRVPGIRSVPIGFSLRKLALDASLSLLVLVLLIRQRYSIVHAVEEAVFLVLPFTWLGVRLVYDLDSLISDQLEYSGVLRRPWLLTGVRRLERLALGRARVAITVCGALTDASRRMVPDATIHQIEDTPLEESLREPAPARVRSLRQELQLEGRQTVVYTGNLEAYQGVDLLLEAVSLLRERVPQAALVLVGGEPADVEVLEGKLKRLDLEEHVTAVGRRPPAEMSEWMSLADVLVSPRNRGENTPLKIYCYMNSGTPIVATRLRTHTQVLDDTNAFLCDPTPEGLAAALAQALEDREDAEARGSTARETARRLYSYSAFEKKLLGAYGEVVAP